MHGRATDRNAPSQTFNSALSLFVRQSFPARPLPPFAHTHTCAGMLHLTWVLVRAINKAFCGFGLYQLAVGLGSVYLDKLDVSSSFRSSMAVMAAVYVALESVMPEVIVQEDGTERSEELRVLDLMRETLGWLFALHRAIRTGHSALFFDALSVLAPLLPATGSYNYNVLVAKYMAAVHQGNGPVREHLQHRPGARLRPGGAVLSQDELMEEIIRFLKATLEERHTLDSSAVVNHIVHAQAEHEHIREFVATCLGDRVDQRNPTAEKRRSLDVRQVTNLLRDALNAYDRPSSSPLLSTAAHLGNKESRRLILTAYEKGKQRVLTAVRQHVLSTEPLNSKGSRALNIPQPIGVASAAKERRKATSTQLEHTNKILSKLLKIVQTNAAARDIDAAARRATADAILDAFGDFPPTLSSPSGNKGHADKAKSMRVVDALAAAGARHAATHVGGGAAAVTGSQRSTSGAEAATAAAGVGSSTAPVTSASSSALAAASSNSAAAPTSTNRSATDAAEITGSSTPASPAGSKSASMGAAAASDVRGSTVAGRDTASAAVADDKVHLIDGMQLVMREASHPGRRPVAELARVIASNALRLLPKHYRVVVLSFDRPDLVPATKAMEQGARTSAVNSRETDGAWAKRMIQAGVAKAGKISPATVVEANWFTADRELRRRVMLVVTAELLRFPWGKDRTVIIDAEAADDPSAAPMCVEAGVVTQRNDLRHRYGEADAAMWYILREMGGTGVVHTSDADAIDFALATSLRSSAKLVSPPPPPRDVILYLPAPGPAAQRRVVDVVDVWNALVHGLPFSIGQHVVPGLPMDRGWTWQQRVGTFLLAKSIAGNDYHEAVGTSPDRVLVSAFTHASTSGPLCDRSGRADDDAMHRLLLRLFYDGASLMEAGIAFTEGGSGEVLRRVHDDLRADLLAHHAPRHNQHPAHGLLPTFRALRLSIARACTYLEYASSIGLGRQSFDGWFNPGSGYVMANGLPKFHWDDRDNGEALCGPSDGLPAAKRRRPSSTGGSADMSSAHTNSPAGSDSGGGAAVSASSSGKGVGPSVERGGEGRGPNVLRRRLTGRPAGRQRGSNVSGATGKAT